MNTLLLHPTDILFFRDGRPMSGSLAGHGAAWPLPTVLNAALHAALWRADIEGASGIKVHGHDQIRLQNGNRERVSKDTRKFGSLVTAGPFPVSPEDVWFFPRPADAQDAENTTVTLLPASITGASSLPAFLTYGLANTEPPTKVKPAAWWNAAAWDAYLGKATAQTQLRPTDFFKTDTDFADTEHAIGIGISPGTGTQNGEQFYSAHYLRLRAGWRLGAFAEARDKDFKDKDGNNDLIQTLFPNSGAETQVIIGGQQRLCSVARHSNVESSPLPLPHGVEITGHRVKWILLTPAIWPEIKADADRGLNAHSGGWLPNWVAEKVQTFDGTSVKAGCVLLLDGPGKEKAKRKKCAPGIRIAARLVAALVPKPIPVTGYALGAPDATSEISNPKSQILPAGAKPTHLAVPAGAVYYFEADSTSDAQALAAALNWHGSPTSEISDLKSQILNRRSTLMGEKGFGLGVCGTWEPFPNS